MARFKQFDFEALSPAPEQATTQWLLGAESSTEFLKDNAQNDEILIYGQASSALIHGVLAPTDKVTPPDADDLQYPNMPMADDSWVIQRAWGEGEGRRIYLEPPLAGSSSASLEGGEKLIYRRSFSGVDKKPRPIELSQKLVHSLGLYFVAERNAYCRLDARGDIEEVIRVVERPGTGVWDGLFLVTILRKDLETYMALSNTSLVLRFDFTRVRRGTFGGWGKIEAFNREETDLFFHGGSDGQGSFIHGAMIVRPQLTVGDLLRQWEEEEDPRRRKYATFKIYDRKNNREMETSCAPECLSNYFQNSDLPWEISPAFFRPEVLHRFKADSEKYTLEDRSISCRGTWHLTTYDINEAGQAHTYIGYLADLPYEEQLYWQSFNEWPKGPISDRAHQTDIVGDWDLQYDPLSSLKHTIYRLDRAPPPWWIVRGEELAASVLYPASDSPQEWGNEILKLDQLLVEGFSTKPLRGIAESKGRKLDPTWGTLKLLQEVLIASGHIDTEAKEIMAPLQALHGLRTTLKGHSSRDTRNIAETEARTKHGTFRQHFKALVADCDKSLAEILKSTGGL